MPIMFWYPISSMFGGSHETAYLSGAHNCLENFFYKSAKVALFSLPSFVKLCRLRILKVCFRENKCKTILRSSQCNVQLQIVRTNIAVHQANLIGTPAATIAMTGAPGSEIVISTRKNMLAMKKNRNLNPGRIVNKRKSPSNLKNARQMMRRLQASKKNKNKKSKFPTTCVSPTSVFHPARQKTLKLVAFAPCLKSRQQHLMPFLMATMFLLVHVPVPARLQPLLCLSSRSSHLTPSSTRDVDVHPVFW